MFDDFELPSVCLGNVWSYGSTPHEYQSWIITTNISPLVPGKSRIVRVGSLDLSIVSRWKIVQLYSSSALTETKPRICTARLWYLIIQDPLLGSRLHFVVQ